MIESYLILTIRKTVIEINIIEVYVILVYELAVYCTILTFYLSYTYIDERFLMTNRYTILRHWLKTYPDFFGLFMN